MNHLTLHMPARAAVRFCLTLVFGFGLAAGTAAGQAVDGSAEASSQDPAPSVHVRLVSGREFSGVADPKSNHDRLWLRFEARSTKVLRPVDWSRIDEVLVDGVQVPVADLQEHISDFVAGDFNIWAEGPDNESQGDPEQFDPWNNSGFSNADAARYVLGNAPRVASISTDVSLGHWDADVEADGLLVTLYPTSEQGWLVPASGTLQVTLYAAQSSKINSQHSVRELGHWSVPVHAEEFVAGPPRYKLPFQAVHPEFDLEVAHLGLVNVKFVSPGSGVFEDSAASVRIRAYSPIRDQLQRDGRARYLPGESVSRPDY